QTSQDEREPFRYYFDASGSYDLEGPIVSYSWDFGDGEIASGIKPFHVFANEGFYNVTLTVQDSAGNSDDATAAVEVACSSSPLGAGNLTWEAWLNVGGTGLAAVDFNSTPDSVSAQTIAEGPVNILDNYGSRLRGYVHAPVSGSYTFWVSSDDNSKLFLSTDETPANAVEIASVSSWTSSREWDKFTSQQSTPITLVGGQRYYIEAQMKEGGGGDNLAIGWQLPTGKLERPIPGDYLTPYGSGGRVSIWYEDFQLSSGATQDLGASAWSVNTSATNGSFTFNTDNNRFRSSDTDGEAVWMSEVLDISTSGSIDVSMAIQSAGGMEAADYIRTYYILDDAAEVLIADRSGNFNGNLPEVVGVNGLSGSSLQVVIRARESAGDESHYVDYVLVEGGALGNVIDLSVSDCRTCATSDAIEIALRGDYGSCISAFADSVLEIQNEYGEGIMAIDDNNQDLGLVTVETFDHGQEAFAQGNYFYGPRSFKIETENTFGSPVQVRLFITEAEYQALAAKDAAITGLNKLKIVRYGDGVLGEPGTGTPHIKSPIVSANTGPGGSHEIIFDNFAFSTFYITGPNTAFPVEGLELKVSQDGNDGLVEWVTASEQNSAHFDIERSLDGENFEAVGAVSAAGTSSSLLEYSFRDENVGNLRQSPLYYRLRQVDLDGAFALSDRVVLRLNFDATLSLEL
ncbi:MAG: PKD domain-containing protein, partial [Bacteroidota bacterium]